MERLLEISQIVRNFALIPGGLIAILGVWLAWQRTELFRQQIRNQREIDTISEEGVRQSRLTEAFSRAIDQLSSDNTATRIGALYTLERLVKLHNNELWPIVETVTGFIRHQSPAFNSRGDWLEPRLGDVREMKKTDKRSIAQANATKEDVKAALHIIGRIGIVESCDEVINISRSNLSDCYLRKGEGGLSFVDMRYCMIIGARFPHVVLRGAKLVGSRIAHSNFSSGDLKECILAQSVVFRSQFIDSDLLGAICNAAHFCDCSFRNANLTEVNFSNCILDGCDFTGATIDGIIVVHAQIRECNGASGLRREINKQNGMSIEEESEDEG